jgi:uncharacterized protein YuzE
VHDLAAKIVNAIRGSVSRVGRLILEGYGALRQGGTTIRKEGGPSWRRFDELCYFVNPDTCPDGCFQLLAIGTLSFDNVKYDADADVLYPSVGEARMPAESFGTPEGHNIRYDETGAVIAITIVNAKWLLDRDGEIKLTIPSRVSAADPALALAG